MRFKSNGIAAASARLALFTSVTVLLGLISGCVNALRPYNQPSQEKLRVQSATPQKYIVRVADKLDYPVAADGRVTVDVPQLDRGCATYLFGVVKVKDSSPYDARAIHLNKDNRTVRELSLNELAKLPLDGQGYHLVKVE
jgi:hypothetical protein